VAKDSSRTDGELQRLVESWGSESLLKKIKQPLHPHMLFERLLRKMLLAHPRTNSSMFSGQTRVDLQTAQGSVVR